MRQVVFREVLFFVKNFIDILKTYSETLHIKSSIDHVDSEGKDVEE